MKLSSCFSCFFKSNKVSEKNVIRNKKTVIKNKFKTNCKSNNKGVSDIMVNNSYFYQDFDSTKIKIRSSRDID